MAHSLRRRPPECFERRFDDMMCVYARKLTQMHRPSRVDSDGSKELRYEFGREITQFRRRIAQIDCQKATPADIDRAVDERFVHRHGTVAHTHNSCTITKRPGKSHSECDSDVFDRVVVVDMRVTDCLHAQAEEPMPRDVRQHVIEKADASNDIAATVPIEIERQANIGLIRFTRDACAARAAGCGGQ